MPESVKIIYRGGTGEITEKKSRFIAHICPIASEQEALDEIARLKKEYWDARHNCFAYLLGPDSRLQRYSDDGEPAGTAGRPMLEVLLNQGLHDCLAVVTRYFGGTLLGTGGLLRAYQGAVMECLNHCETAVKSFGRLYTIRCDYNSIGKIQYLLGQEHIPVSDTRYTDAVETDLLMTEEDFRALIRKINELTAGQAEVRKGPETPFLTVNGRTIPV
jgi:uncharacterized YigZ family protein